MRFLLLAIALLAISLTPPIVAQSSDGAPETEADAPMAVSKEEEEAIRDRINATNHNMTYYDMHFSVKDAQWSIDRRRKMVKKLKEKLTKNEEKAEELKQNLTKARNDHAVLSKQYEENLEMKEYNEKISEANVAREEYAKANAAYEAINKQLVNNRSSLNGEEVTKVIATEEKEKIDKYQNKVDDLQEYLNNMNTRTQTVIQGEIQTWEGYLEANKTKRNDATKKKLASTDAATYEKLKCSIVLKYKKNEEPCKSLKVRAEPLLKEEQTSLNQYLETEKELLKLKAEHANYVMNGHSIPREISNIKLLIPSKDKLANAEAVKIKKAEEEINRLTPIVDKLELEVLPLEEEKNRKELAKNAKEALISGGPPAGGVEMELAVNQSSAAVSQMEAKLKETNEIIPVFKKFLAEENYEYYYETELLKDVIKRREEKTAQLKQMRFNWPRESIKLMVIWSLLFVVPVVLIVQSIWRATTAADGLATFPFGPKPFWFGWLFGNREYWCDVKEREIGDRNTHQQPYRELPEMWWPLKPWDIYTWIVVKVLLPKEEEEAWDDDLFLRSDPFQRDITLYGEEYREDAQWDGAYASLQAHFDDFNEAYFHFNRKDNARNYKIINPDKMAGAYGPLLERRKRYRHPDHKYPLYVPPPPPPMRPAKRIPRYVPVEVIPKMNYANPTPDLPEPGPDELVNYDGEVIPKRKHRQFYLRLHHRMRKESQLFCYKPWTRKWINDHFANYHEKPANHSGGSKKRGRKRGKKRSKIARSTAGRESTSATRKFSKKHHRKHHGKNLKAVENDGEKQALAGKLRAVHKKHCKRYRKRVRIANLTPEQQKRLAKRSPRVLHRRTLFATKMRRMPGRAGVKNRLKKILMEVALLEKRRDGRKEKRAEKVKANAALLDAKHLKIRARKLRKHQARLRAANLRLDYADHERSGERRKKRHATQRDLHAIHTYKYHEHIERGDASDDPADISDDEEERMNEEERAEYDPFPILQYPDPKPRRPKHHKHCRFYERKKACQKGDKYAKLHAAKHNMVHDHLHLVSQKRVQECPPNCHHHGGTNAADAHRLHHEQKRATKAAQGARQLIRKHTKEHIRRHHEMHHQRPHMPHQDALTRIKWTRIKHDRVLWRKWNKDKLAEYDKQDEEYEEEQKKDQKKDDKSKKKDEKEEKKDKKEKKKKRDRKGPDGQPIISSIPDPDGWKVDKEEDEERQEQPTQVGTGKIPVKPNEKLERLDPMPDTPEEATQALTRTQAERTLEDKTQAVIDSELEPPPMSNKHAWPLPPSAPTKPPANPEDDITQDDKTAAPAAAAAAKKPSLPREDKPSKAGPPSTFRI